MGRVFIPELMFTHKVVPFESLIRGLAEALQAPGGDIESSCRGRQNDEPCCRREGGDPAERKQNDEPCCRRQGEDHAERKQNDESCCRRQGDDPAERKQNDESCCRREGGDSACRRHCDARMCGRLYRRVQPGCPGFTPWFCTSVQLGRYRAPEISVRVEHGRVVLHARREERYGDDLDLTETIRTVTLPPCVNQERMLCFLRPDGRVVIKAPLNGQRDPVESPQADSASTETAQSPKRDAKSEEETETNKPNAKSESSVEIGASEASDVPTIDQKSTDKDAEFYKKEMDDQALTGDGSAQNSLPVNDNGVNVENFVEKEIFDEDEDEEASLAPSEDFLIVDNTPAEPADYFVQDMKVAETDTRNEPESVSADNGQELKPQTDSVRIIEDGQKTFEVSLNLKDFGAENMSVRFVDNELFIDAKKETEDDGVYSLQEVHRKYAVPDAGILDAARAQITGDGVVTVTVPLEAEEKGESITVPIVQLE